LLSDLAPLRGKEKNVWERWRVEKEREDYSKKRRALGVGGFVQQRVGKARTKNPKKRGGGGREVFFGRTESAPCQTLH
jgi:hypothetical protein